MFEQSVPESSLPNRLAFAIDFSEVPIIHCHCLWVFWEVLFMLYFINISPLILHLCNLIPCEEEGTPGELGTLVLLPAIKTSTVA